MARSVTSASTNSSQPSSRPQRSRTRNTQSEIEAKEPPSRQAPPSSRASIANSANVAVEQSSHSRSSTVAASIVAAAESSNSSGRPAAAEQTLSAPANSAAIQQFMTAMVEQMKVNGVEQIKALEKIETAFQRTAAKISTAQRNPKRKHHDMDGEKKSRDPDTLHLRQLYNEQVKEQDGDFSFDKFYDDPVNVERRKAMLRLWHLPNREISERACRMALKTIFHSEKQRHKRTADEAEAKRRRSLLSMRAQRHLERLVKGWKIYCSENRTRAGFLDSGLQVLVPACCPELVDAIAEDGSPLENTFEIKHVRWLSTFARRVFTRAEQNAPQHKFQNRLIDRGEECERDITADVPLIGVDPRFHPERVDERTDDGELDEADEVGMEE